LKEEKNIAFPPAVTRRGVDQKKRPPFLSKRSNPGKKKRRKQRGCPGTSLAPLSAADTGGQDREWDGSKGERKRRPKTALKEKWVPRYMCKISDVTINKGREGQYMARSPKRPI